MWFSQIYKTSHLKNKNKKIFKYHKTFLTSFKWNIRLCLIPKIFEMIMDISYNKKVLFLSEFYGT